jgi:hypothetical protein
LGGCWRRRGARRAVGDDTFTWKQDLSKVWAGVRAGCERDVNEMWVRSERGMSVVWAGWYSTYICRGKVKNYFNDSRIFPWCPWFLLSHLSLTLSYFGTDLVPIFLYWHNSANFGPILMVQ